MLTSKKLKLFSTTFPQIVPLFFAVCIVDIRATSRIAANVRTSFGTNYVNNYTKSNTLPFPVRLFHCPVHPTVESLFSEADIIFNGILNDDQRILRSFTRAA